jgi:sugar phosphate isomerase/epimerase
MHIGLLTSVFHDRSLEEVLDRVHAYGLGHVELGTGGYPGNAHCDPDTLLADAAALESFTSALRKHDIHISALACHGNPLHPDRATAESYHRVFQQTVRLAERLQVERLTLFSGCPGDSEASTRPNWVACAWPPDYQAVLDWQWREKVVPYWREQAAFARSHGVTKLCFEMHPGFVVYNPGTLLKLREAVGEEIGANLDPSHLFWQGIDVIAAIRYLKDAIYHVHAKDTAFNSDVARRNGFVDTTPLDCLSQRAWVFRTIGYGHDELFWRQFVSVLREVGYDDVLSIEHEDLLASQEEGVRRAVSVLQSCVLVEPPAQPWWTA